MEALTYERAALVESLKAKLAEREAERTAAREEQAIKNSEISERISQALDDHPQFVVVVVAAIREKLNLNASEESFSEAIAEFYEDGDPQTYDPDASLRKLIRVYEGASDETVKVSVGDDAYLYI